MTHYSRVFRAVIDVPADVHVEELAFWDGATGLAWARLEKHPEYHVADLYGQQFGLLVQRLGEGTGRIHLDIHTDDLDAEVSRLERLGARRVQRVHEWWIMRDPAGLLFCVVPDPPGTLNDGNAHRWD
jgi:Glyoxalase-like domain